MHKKEKELFEIATLVLNLLKVPCRMAGFDYLRRSIIICLNSSECLDQITNKLYPLLAEEFNTNCITVERNIRSALEGAECNDGHYEVNEFFDLNIYEKIKLTNSEAIYLSVEMAKLIIEKLNLLDNINDKDNDKEVEEKIFSTL